MSDNLRDSLYQDGELNDLKDTLNGVAKHEQGGKVQYIYPILGLPRFALSQANPNAILTPTIPLNAFSPVTGLVSDGERIPNSAAMR